MSIEPKRYHLIFDIHNYPHKRINKNFLTKILEELPTFIGMQIIAGPIVANGVKENPGLSGFVIIDYSHISIHTFSRYNKILIDVFSCKLYNRELVIRFLLDTLGIKRASIKTKTVSWG